MADLRARSLRLFVGLSVVVLGVIEVQGLTLTVRRQGEQRRRAMRRIEEALRSVRPEVEALLRRGGEVAWREALRAALHASGAAEAELFEGTGRPLAALPGPAPVEHWPPAAQMAALEARSVLGVGPVAGGEPRVLAYAAALSGERRVVLRLATPAPELVEDLRERRELLLGHGAALLTLLVLGAFVLLPVRGSAPNAPPRAVDAYVEALERLRRHGEALSQRHQSERQRMEDELRDKDAMARAGELTAGIVHEMRNGLGTILGYARLIEHAGSAPGAAEAAGRIRQECETLETVVRRFMDLVTRETLKPERVDLGRLLSRVVAREAHGRPGPHVTLRVGEDQVLEADEDLLERAFENLVRNACEASPGGHVWIQSAEEAGGFRVLIADDGPGMSPEARSRIRPFATTKAKGLGLGLPTVLKIVRMHGGDLVLEERHPRGLAVTVRLPRAAVLPEA